MVTVRARNEIGWGAHAEKVIYTESDVPSAPKRVQASEDSQQSISVQWMKPHCHGSEIIRYGLQCRENGKDWVMICGNITGTTYTFTKTNDCLLLSGVLHAVRVRAMNSVGWGPFSNGSAAECQLILDRKSPRDVVDFNLTLVQPLRHVHRLHLALWINVLRPSQSHGIRQITLVVRISQCTRSKRNK